MLQAEAQFPRAPDPAPPPPLRPPAQVMRLDRLGRSFATRLSFMPTLLRRLARSGATVERVLWDLGAEGYGRAVLGVRLEGRAYGLVAFTRPLAPEERSDRVIAEAWDATFALFDGLPEAHELAELEANVPRQEAGRYSAKVLVLSRANKSMRMFEHTVERLAAGRQPDAEMVAGVGYLMRTTAVYGNGKFGIADRERIADRPEFAGAFQAEMLAVYLIRCFTQALAEHVARARGGATAVPLAPALRRYLGVGNSTGLGMAPFLIGHPVLLNNWIMARETALSRVRGLTRVEPDRMDAFRRLLERAQAHLQEWCVEDPEQAAATSSLRRELEELQAASGPGLPVWQALRPWDSLYRLAEERMGLEGQELVVSLLLEPYGDLVDGLAECMTAPDGGQLDPTMSVARLRELVALHYGWALAVDFADPRAQARFWYVSEEKLEPRLGERALEPGADKEMPVAIARDVQALDRALAACSAEGPAEERLASFLLRHPELRHIARRVQVVAQHPYGEIRDNLIDAGCRPLDLLRCKLAFFGAAKFDPKSDRWTRIAMYQGAPLPEDLAAHGRTHAAANWCLPVLGAACAATP